MRPNLLLGVSSTCLAMAQGKSTKPNILVIMGDYIGYWNLSYNNDAMMGYKTPRTGMFSLAFDVVEKDLPTFVEFPPC